MWLKRFTPLMEQGSVTIEIEQLAKVAALKHWRTQTPLVDAVQLVEHVKQLKA